jgi:hypothetical protein
MHENGETRLGIAPEQTFAGQSLPRQAPHIKRLIQQTAAQSILDYGSGKGHQYSLRRISTCRPASTIPTSNRTGM